MLTILEDNPLPKNEEPESKLPKTCYFSDGKRKIDIVLAYNIDLPEQNQQIAIFLNNLTEKGVQIEKTRGKIFPSICFVKVHTPFSVLERYVKIFNINLACRNPHYKYQQDYLFKCLASVLVVPRPTSKTYSRANVTLSGDKPARMTTAERSYITYNILQTVHFGPDPEDVGISKLVDMEVFDAYPLHDGAYRWTLEGPLTDRQLLFRYWSSAKHILIEQPTHLLEKYYGPHIAFYFAFTNFYIKMLLIPTILGVLSMLGGWIFLLESDGAYIKNEVCNSNLRLCSNQYLKNVCGLYKFKYVIDNPFTVVHVLLCAFWGAAFQNLWQRKQAMLRLRWNLLDIQYDRTMRAEFKTKAPTRISSITGEIEHYVPVSRKILLWLLTYSMLLLICFFLLVLVFLLMWFRKYLTNVLDYEHTKHANELELFLTSTITAISFIVISINLRKLVKIGVNLKWLAGLRLPRSKRQYNRVLVHVEFIVVFATNFTPMIYYAYFKGNFYTHPGDVLHPLALDAVLRTDICKVPGCLIEVSTQLFMIMVLMNTYKMSQNLFWHYVTYYKNRNFLRASRDEVAQWESDYILKPQNGLNSLYIDLALQYAFMTFFNAAFPLAPLAVLIFVVIQKQIDAYTFTTLYRRPLVERVGDIGGWNDVLKVLTICGIFSNSIILAFRNDFVSRMMYRTKTGSLNGYILTTLSEFAISDFHAMNPIKDLFDNKTVNCWYGGQMLGPLHERKYEPREDYYHELYVRAIYFIVLQNVTLILALFISYVIPVVPRKVKLRIAHDQQVFKEMAENKIEKILHYNK